MLKVWAMVVVLVKMKLPKVAPEGEASGMMRNNREKT